MYSPYSHFPAHDITSVFAIQALKNAYNFQSGHYEILELELTPSPFPDTRKDVGSIRTSSHPAPVAVLVVDDDDNFRHAFIESLLELSNMDVSADEAETGEDAITKLTNTANDFDVIFLDLILPEMDGLEVHNQVVKLDLRARIVLMTSDPNSAVATSALQLGLAVYRKEELRMELVGILSSRTRD